MGDRPGRQKKVVSESEYARLKKEIEEKKRLMAEMAVEPAIPRKKKRMGIRGRDREPVAGRKRKSPFYGPSMRPRNREAPRA